MTTPTYILNYRLQGQTQTDWLVWNCRAKTNAPGYGLPTPANIAKLVAALENSIATSGIRIDTRTGKTTDENGYYTTEARIAYAEVIHQPTGEIMNDWVAPAFTLSA